MKPYIVIVRVHSDNQGTWGVLAVDGYACYTIELPWKNNTPWISCVSEGEYRARLDMDTLMGGVGVIRILDGEVENRTGILIHVANFAGDKTEGFNSEVYGCIGVGESYYTVPQKKVYPSVPAMRSIIKSVENNMGLNEFIIKITSIQSITKQAYQGVGVNII